jgi:chromosome segregation ATPase
MDDDPQLPKSPQIPLKLENPSQEPELLKTIEKLKGELAKRDLIIAEKDRQLQNKNSEISLLTNENQKLKAINHQKDIKLKELQEKLKELTEQNNSLIQNYSTLKNTAKKPIKNPVNNNQIEPKPPQEKNIRKISPNSGENLPKNNSLAVKEKEVELVAQIQV